MTYQYAELHCLSSFSFLRGASQPEELVERARELKYKAIAITDECSVSGVVRAHLAAKSMVGIENGEPVRSIHFIVGSEFRLDCGTKFVALAMNRTGYGRLCRLITCGRRASEKGTYHLTRTDVETYLTQCVILWIPADIPNIDEAHWLSKTFPSNVWIAVELLRTGTDRDRLTDLTRISHETRLPLVATGDVHMHERRRRALQDVMTAIRHNVPIYEAGWHLFPNGERHLRPIERLARLYPSELLAETLAIAARCTFSLDELRYEYPHELVPEGETPTTYLRKLTEEGAKERWPGGVTEKVRAQIENELSIIKDLKYEPYFLTVQDIVAFARSRGILCQGRGSAANSAVCYCLGVTEVDPARSTLVFERFISRERAEPPDIDIDFEHDLREEVIQYVYQKYGRARAALAATVIMYRPRSAMRDLGKAFGLDPLQIGKLTGMVQWWDVSIPAERVREAGFDPENPLILRILMLAKELVGFPRHLSQHVGGFVISEGLLEELVPIENASMADRTVVQWDKDDLNDLGLLKVDLLALGMLSALHRAFRLIHHHRGKSYTLGSVPAEDPKVYEMIQRADTIGVFQIESRAQMSMLPRLKPKEFYDLVVEVAIVRPGPIQGDMVHPYLRRREGKEAVDYPSDDVKGVLWRTLGVPIFQEQVMQLAIVAAGFTPGEADQLRRAMAAWKRRGGLGPFKEKLINGMRERNYTQDFAERIFRQIMGFGEYGFPECVAGETRIVDADTGRWLTIDEIMSGVVSLKNTLACDDDLHLRKRRVVAVVPSGVKPVLRLRTALGHTITATAEHPFMTMMEWRKLGELKMGDYIASARSLPIKGTRSWPRHEILVLADLIAEGNLCHPNTFYFYTTAEWHRDEFVKAVERFPNTRAVIERNKGCFSVRVRRIDRGQPTGAMTWAKSLGIWQCGARQKRLPAEVFELCENDMGLLLARLWEGDGGFSMKGHASYDTASERLGNEVQHLLLRLGIVARLYRRKRIYKGRLIQHQVVTVTGDEALCQFWRQVGCHFLDPEKKRRSKALATIRTGRMSRDIVPIDVRTLIHRERKAQGLTWLEIGRRSRLSMRGIQGRAPVAKNGFRRPIIGRLGQVLGSPELMKLSSSDIFWDRIVSIESVGEQPTYDLQIDGDHNFLANNLVVHNSHASSFALLVYDSAWIKCHEPAAFCCALLNSQPMGFYAPAQLVRDAREHGVEVRPVRVESSDYDSTLERREDGELALRLGMSLVKSLSRAGGERVAKAREERPFTSVQDLGERARLDRGDLEALAAAGALASLSGNRHLAFWEVAGTEKPMPLAARDSNAWRIEEGRPLLAAPTERQTIEADYNSVGLTLGRHPLALLRDQLRAENLVSSKELTELPDGSYVRTAGIVLLRQHPANAKGVTFLTIEDEMGQINLIVWKDVAEMQRRPMVESRLLEVHGKLQKQQGVMHVIVQRLIDRSALAGRLTTYSRDFH